MAYVQRSGNQFIGNQFFQLEDRSRRSERTDAERVEEVRDKADCRLKQRRSFAAIFFHSRSQRDDEKHRETCEREYEESFDCHGCRNFLKWFWVC